ncbi:MAG: type II secretion system protein [Patescibacteria group bacterium]
MKKWSKEAGFTIIELMIAIGVFSVVLVLASASLITVGRQYQKASISTTTQNVARLLMEDVTSHTQLSSNAPLQGTPGNGQNGIPGGGDDVLVTCLGAVRFSYIVGWQLESSTNVSKHQSKHVLWKDVLNNQSNCVAPDLQQENPSLGTGSAGKELLSVHTRLLQFNIVTVLNNLVSIDVSVIYGDDDVLDNLSSFPSSIAGCLDEKSGGAFCSLSELHTTVIRRLN